MSEVILIRPAFLKGLKFSDYSRESRPPSGLLYVAAPLVQHGFDVVIIDQSAEKNWKEILLSEITDKTLCIGITCLTGYMIINAIDIVKLVRNHSRCPIVWGGTHPTLDVDTTINSEYSDIIVNGEGEETFLELVNALKNKESYENIKGITYKKEGKIYKNSPREQYNLNDLPPLPLHLVTMDNYKGHSGLSLFFRFKNPIALSIETSRGCTHKCSYCVLASNNYKDRSKWRSMSATRTVDMIEEINKKFGINAFVFVDNNFFVNMHRVTDFLDEIEKRNLNIEWFADIRMDTIVRKMDAAFLKRLEKSGLRTLGIGIESGSNRILDSIHKGETYEIYIEANRMLSTTNIVPRFGILQGLPGESRDDAAKTYKLVIELLKDNPKCVPKLNKLIPTPHTPIMDECIKNGFLPPQKLEDWTVYCDPGWDHGPSPWMDKEAAKFIMSQLYYNAILTLSLAKPTRGPILRTILKFSTKLLLYRIEKRFYSFKVEMFFYRLFRLSLLRALLKNVYSIYLRYHSKVTARG